jgi:Domain of unknown function (DUF4249)
MIMNKLRSPALATLLTCTILVACSTDDDATQVQPLVVESYLYVNHPFKVVVSDLIGAPATDVNAFSLTISHGDQTIYMNTIGNGTYVSDSSVLVEDNTEEYTLKFINDGTEISALAVVPSKPANFAMSVTELEIEARTGGFPMGGPGNFNDNSIDLTWSNPDKGYYFVLLQNIEKEPQLINASINGMRPNVFFRGTPTQENTGVIRANQFEYYGRYNVILFHINADYAALYKEQDNSSSLNLQPPFTNVINGMGIFTAIHSDTLMLTIKKP